MKYSLLAIATFCSIFHGFPLPLLATDLTPAKSFLTDLAQNVDLNPRSAKDYLERGVFYFQSGQYHQALADYDQAIKINPQSAEAYSHLGSIYALLGHLTQTRQNWQQASTLFQQQNNLPAYQLIQQALKQLPPLD